MKHATMWESSDRVIALKRGECGICGAYVSINALGTQLYWRGDRYTQSRSVYMYAEQLGRSIQAT